MRCASTPTNRSLPFAATCAAGVASGSGSPRSAASRRCRSPCTSSTPLDLTGLLLRRSLLRSVDDDERVLPELQLRGVLQRHLGPRAAQGVHLIEPVQRLALLPGLPLRLLGRARVDLRLHVGEVRLGLRADAQACAGHQRRVRASSGRSARGADGRSRERPTPAALMSWQVSPGCTTMNSSSEAGGSCAPTRVAASNSPSASSRSAARPERTCHLAAELQRIERERYVVIDSTFDGTGHHREIVLTAQQHWRRMRVGGQLLAPAPVRRFPALGR